MTSAEARKAALEVLFELCLKHRKNPSETRLSSIKELSANILESMKFSRWLSRR